MTPQAAINWHRWPWCGSRCVVPPPRGWISPAEAACAAQVHKPAVWLHKCVSDHAAVHRAPLVAVLLNSIFQVVGFPVLTLPGDAAPSNLQPGAGVAQRELEILAALQVARGLLLSGQGQACEWTGECALQLTLATPKLRVQAVKLGCWAR